MSASIPGLITVAGLLVSWWYVRADSICTCVHKAWWGMFLAFCASTAAFNLGVGLNWFWWYATPAVIAMCSAVWVFYPSKLSATVWVFAALFAVNMVGGLMHVDAYKLVGPVDVLDVFTWVQIALLWRLRIENPDEGLSYGDNEEEDNNTSAFRLAHGNVRDVRTGAKT